MYLEFLVADSSTELYDGPQLQMCNHVVTLMKVEP